MLDIEQNPTNDCAPVLSEQEFRIAKKLAWARSSELSRLQNLVDRMRHGLNGPAFFVTINGLESLQRSILTPLLGKLSS